MRSTNISHNASPATSISRRLRALACSLEGFLGILLLLCGQNGSVPSSVRTALAWESNPGNPTRPPNDESCR
jgi:hypothetical protein